MHDAATRAWSHRAHSGHGARDLPVAGAAAEEGHTTFAMALSHQRLVRIVAW